MLCCCLHVVGGVGAIFTFSLLGLLRAGLERARVLALRVRGMPALSALGRLFWLMARLFWLMAQVLLWGVGQREELSELGCVHVVLALVLENSQG